MQDAEDFPMLSGFSTPTKRTSIDLHDDDAFPRSPGTPPMPCDEQTGRESLSRAGSLSDFYDF